jgi:hypothetical protein
MMRFSISCAVALGVAACGAVACHNSSPQPATAGNSPRPSPSTPAPSVNMSSLSDPSKVPAHLQQFPGLTVRRGDQIVEASGDDVAVARGYPTSVAKGSWVDQRRLTILTARAQVRIGEPVRVIHIVETTRPDDQLHVMGPKAVLGEHVDGVLRTGPAPVVGDPLAPTGLYDGRVEPAPAVDYNWDITEYTFDTTGRHTIEWKLGGLVSNLLAIEVLP